MKVILISHGGMAKGLAQSYEMICGQTKELLYASLENGEGIVDYKQKLSKLITEEDNGQLVVLSDIRGGSPYTTCLEILSEKNMLNDTKVIAGMNLPLLISLLLSPEETHLEKINKAILDAKDSIECFELLESDDMELL